MSLLRRALIALLAVLTMLPFAGTEAAAAPATDDTDAPAPRAAVSRTADDVIVKITDGQLAVDDGYLVIKDRSGKELERYNLTFVAPDESEYEVAAAITGDTATLTPNPVAKRKAAPRATPQRERKPGEIVCGPQTRAQRDQEALTRMNSELGTAATIGGLIGTGVGAVLAIASLGTLAVAIPIGALIGVGIALGGSAATGTFDRYNKTVRKPFQRTYC